MKIDQGQSAELHGRMLLDLITFTVDLHKQKLISNRCFKLRHIILVSLHNLLRIQSFRL